MSQSSWFEIPAESDFSLANLPFGVISHAGLAQPHPAVAIGNHALDLSIFADAGGFSKLSEIQPHLNVFKQETLNGFAALGRPFHRKVREYLRSLFLEGTPYPDLLRDNQKLRRDSLIPLAKVSNRLPIQIGDYTDFYAGKNHAYNVGVLFRGPANALQPNYTNLPVAYHGRASSVVISGTPIRRPWGQILDADKNPTYQPCKRLDIELELGVLMCKSNIIGSPVPIARAEDHIFGYVLMNDWSARDIQAWEYVPLGPFNSKNFGTTISAWVVLADALEPFRTEGIKNDTQLQSYLQPLTSRDAFDINLEVDIRENQNVSTVTKTNAKNLLWSFPQMVAHHTVAGCPLNVGDLFGSGTISGTEPGSQGSLLEVTEGGKTPVKLSSGAERVFLADGDEITIRGWSEKDGTRVGFGSCTGQILEAWKNGYEQ
ncbi:hypothetical protein JX266_010988 [Neoarthrinium moseri]|nr:hypothetical protein JX266_010988 [Neoarthrinium moseri]